MQCCAHTLKGRDIRSQPGPTGLLLSKSKVWKRIMPCFSVGHVFALFMGAKSFRAGADNAI